MMSDSSGPSIDVLARISASGAEGFERWFDATVDALVGSVTLGAVGSWGLSVRNASGVGALDQAAAVAFADRARRAGGGLQLIDDTPSSTGGDLVLLLDERAVILASTIDRMVRSLSGTVDAVAARQLPREHKEHGCVLITRAAVDAGRLDDLERAQDAPDSVYFLDGTSSSPPTTGRSTGSLIEDVVALAGVHGAESELTTALSAPGDPLLSVVMRTQGQRLEPLRDVLLCLAGQSDVRFELILVVHDGNADDVQQVLGDQPGWLRSRTRVVAAVGGTRSRPLNVGIAAATGSLITFLDDDDLVFADWVSAFLEAAARHPHRLLRAWAGVQHVATTVWPGGLEGHRDESAMTTPYPEAFDLADHLRVNMSPFMTFAFPTRFFGVFGGADESLQVCEDWDLVLRAASVLGVGDEPRVTSIYRRWNSGRDSYSLHDSEVWNRDMAQVRAKLDASPLLLPAGAATELAALSAARAAEVELAAVHRSSSWRITAPLRALSARLREPRSRGR